MKDDDDISDMLKQLSEVAKDRMEQVFAHSEQGYAKPHSEAANERIIEILEEIIKEIKSGNADFIQMFYASKEGFARRISKAFGEVKSGNLAMHSLVIEDQLNDFKRNILAYGLSDSETKSDD